MAVADDAPLPDERAFHRRFWRVQRASWVAFALLLLLAIAGLTGAGGPLARLTATLPGATIDYPRVSRWQSADQLTIRLQPGAAERRIWIGSDFSAHFRIDGVEPVLLENQAMADGQLLTVGVEPGAAAEVMLHLRVRRPGRADFTIGIDDARVVLRSWVLP